MASKRPAEGETSSAPPPFKKVQFEPIQIGPVSNLEEMDFKILKFRNIKLSQHLEERKRTDSELRQRIEQLEKRQTQDDAVLNVVNRYWNQFNEDIRLLLQRFDAETADELEHENECKETTSFVAQLSTWDKEELDEKLANRVQVSKRAVAKIIQAFDRLMQRNEKITMVLKGNQDGEEPSIDETIKHHNIELQAENTKLQSQFTELHERYHAMSLKVATFEDEMNAKVTEAAELKNRVEELQYDLSKQQHRSFKLEHHLAEAMEKVKQCQQLHKEEEVATPVKSGTPQEPSVSQMQLEEVQKECEEQRELANNRLQEIEDLLQKYKEVVKEKETLRLELHQLPETIIVETTEYKCLQSRYSVLYNEYMQLKTLLEETRHQLQASKTSHFKQIEQMEVEELKSQRDIRYELMQYEELLTQARKKYETLQIEYEQKVAANDQTGPINIEMRGLITSLQTHNNQLKIESQRYKRKYKDASNELLKVKKDLEDLQNCQPIIEPKQELPTEPTIKEEENSSCSSLAGIQTKEEQQTLIIKDEDETEEEDGSNSQGERDKITGSPLKKEKEVKKEVCNLEKEPIIPTSPGSQTPQPPQCPQTSGSVQQPIQLQTSPQQQSNAQPQQPCRSKEVKSAESEYIRELKAQNKKLIQDCNDLRTLLEVHKKTLTEKRDRIQLMVAEEKARAECEELRQQLRKIQDIKREERKKMSDDDAMRKIRVLEDKIHALQKQVATHKQEEEALLADMEKTGQAYEDMQEQNTRLIQQLNDKDELNFKLMSESSKCKTLLKIEKDKNKSLEDHNTSLLQKVESKNTVVRKLEEKDRLLSSYVQTIQNESNQRQQALDIYKRKAIESGLTADELRAHLEKLHAQMKEAQQVVTEKTSALEAEPYKNKRLQEEIAQLKRKLERMKQFEIIGTQTVLMAEIQEYKDMLTCQSCRHKRKDAVLSKCFHVFCYDCLRTRYETRQRKCPQCNAAFGANDFHRLYLTN